MENSCQKFGLNLLETLLKDKFDQNVIYSPLSIYIALGMTLRGAKGETASEMMNTLHWDTNSSDSFHSQLSECIKFCNVTEDNRGTIKIANRLFLEEKYNLLESYSKSMSDIYSGAIERMNFQTNSERSRQEINKWVEKQTNSKIVDLLQSGTVHNLTRLILVNAIYFNGSWAKEFSIVGDESFHLLNGTTKSTKMMQKIMQYKYLRNDNIKFSAVQIPFKIIGNNEYSFMIILPNDKCSLEKVEKSIFKEGWKSVLDNAHFQYSCVKIKMPLFKIECSFSLKDELKKLGMVIAFTGGADFSLMTGAKDLCIDDVIHKAFIDINEHGVEAAAATAVMMMRCCALMDPEDPIEFTCDHPFMFALVKQGSLPLFVGHFTTC